MRTIKRKPGLETLSRELEQKLQDLEHEAFNDEGAAEHYAEVNSVFEVLEQGGSKEDVLSQADHVGMRKWCEKFLIIFAVILISACGAQDGGGYLDTSVCSKPNSLHGIYEDVDGAQYGIMTLDGCDFKYEFSATGCVLFGQYSVKNASSGEMKVQIFDNTPSCVGSIPEKSSCTFNRNEPHVDLDCEELDMSATLRRQGT